MRLTFHDWFLLEGLAEADRAYISATEYIPATRLCNRGYAKTWRTGEGFPVWQITDKGREAVTIRKGKVDDNTR